MTDLELVNYYLSMKIIRDRVNRIIRLSQIEYVKQILKDHDM